ncbi:MAG: urea ABC transporter ATP-binding subunit UrtE [Planctomycetia bacterium]|nr:urea ABC transporter ATP-binding subunit UrtE [Planctomycetia bacterium]
MLSIQNLSFSYGAVQALRNINMTMAESRVTCVMGRNGVGKTTLMKNIMGLLRPTAGSILTADGDITPLSAHRRARAGLALVPEGRQIFPNLTVEENLQVSLAARRDGSKTIPGHVYELFPGLKTMLKRMGGDLSGGQQQQLAIARSLVAQPKVLLLDEPTEGIQPNIIKQIGQVLHTLTRDLKITVVLVEQYLDFVKEFGHQFYIMNRGQVVAEGATSDLTSDIVRRHLSV